MIFVVCAFAFVLALSSSPVLASAFEIAAACPEASDSGTLAARIQVLERWKQAEQGIGPPTRIDNKGTEPCSCSSAGAGRIHAMTRPIWAGLAAACLIYLLYTAWATWQALDSIGSSHRLLNIGIIILLGWLGGECIKRARD